jgi:hypothetical protein
MASESRALKPIVEEIVQPTVLENVRPATLTRAETFVSDYRLLEQIAKGMIGGSLTPSGVKNVSDVVVILMLGEELGLDYMQALRNIYVIEGRPVLSADMMAGAVKRYCQRQGGGYLHVVESTAESCTVEYKRHDEPEARTVTWTTDDAKRAGLLSRQNWQRYPADMLKARAITRAARIGWPDVLGGIYDADEVTTVAHPETRTVHTAASVSVNQPEPATPAAIAAPVEPKPNDDTPIAGDALTVITEKATERGVVGIEFDHLVWYRFEGLGSPASMTTAQGRDLFRWLRDSSEEEISAEMWSVNNAVNAWLDQQAAMEESAREQQVAQAK